MASILKSNTTEGSVGPSGVAGFNLDDFASSSRRLLEQAQEQAQQILADARQQAQEITKKAHREGLAAGMAEARKTVDQDVAQQVQTQVQERLGVLEQTARELSESQAEWLQSFAQTLTDLGLGIAEKIIKQRLQNDPQIVLDWTEQALRHARSARSLVVAVHPETLVQLGQPLEALLQASGVPEDARLEPDESLEPHGVVVRQLGGSIDAQLSSQLENLQRMLQA
ncbi:FliH/SctL family protein [Roseimaritima ulvae]|uniref:Flagellar assembly protein FliH n=1 Tax=Roseimaritima ulvae TaxID=980254 RepID=A0A5B9R850_9BACT|nr:FliH/SctL family protein [Roseimaritima ulvae]QEG42733.1 flagellar assembly protein H [Roseimaritima ulvae]